MASRRVIVVSPVLVTSAAHDDLARGPFRTALAARRAGADVLYMGLAEPAVAGAARALFEELGVAVDLLEAARASRPVTGTAADDGGASCPAGETRLPDDSAVDRLLDRMADHLVTGAACVVVAADLTDKDPCDFGERAVGRAWGLGVRTLLVENGAALKQAFHAQPLGAFLEADEIAVLLPCGEGSARTREEILKEVFDDPVRILLLRESNGVVTAATRDGCTELGPLGDAGAGELIGALAARMISCEGDVLRAAREARATLDSGAGPS